LAKIFLNTTEERETWVPITGLPAFTQLLAASNWCSQCLEGDLEKLSFPQRCNFCDNPADSISCKDRGSHLERALWAADVVVLNLRPQPGWMAAGAPLSHARYQGHSEWDQPEDTLNTD
jgi:hypothetical protein